MEYKFINADRNVEPEDIPEIKEWMKNEDVNQFLPEQNHTLLEYATMGGVLEVVKFLIENGADPAVYSGEWLSLVELAAMHGRLDTIKYLLTNDICRKEFEKDNSAIVAAYNGFPEVVKYLIEQGKDIDAEQDYHDGDGPIEGFTALRAAAQENQVETVKLLCEMGANVNVQGDDTPLYSAASEGHFEVVKVLIDYGADVNNDQSVGGTALHVACHNSHVDVVQFLLLHGANPTLLDYEGHDCLFDASHGGNKKLEKLMLDAMKNYKK